MKFTTLSDILNILRPPPQSFSPFFLTRLSSTSYCILLVHYQVVKVIIVKNNCLIQQCRIYLTRKKKHTKINAENTLKIQITGLRYFQG